jgi:hypothetical protein
MVSAARPAWHVSILDGNAHRVFKSGLLCRFRAFFGGRKGGMLARKTAAGNATSMLKNIVEEPIESEH